MERRKTDAKRLVAVRRSERDSRKTDAKRLVAVRRSERDRKKTKARRLVSMRRIGRDRSNMKHLDRYPKLQLRVGDELLMKIEKEIKKSGMNTSEILTKALNEYFQRSKELEN